MSLSNKIRGLKEVWGFDNRWWLTMTKVFFRRENLHVYRYKGLEIVVDHAGGDANGAREVLTTPMYSRFLPQMKLNGPANVLDLGANNGGFPLLLHSAGIELKRVVSVELNPQTFVRLHFNLTRNLQCEVFPVNAALCGERQKLQLSLGKGSVSDSIYAENHGPAAKECEIDGRTLDDFFDSYFPDETVDICKIDVEGAEFEVFASPHIGSLSRCRYVIMEIHERNGRRAEEIIPVLEGLGFTRRSTDEGADPTVHFFVNISIE